MLSSENGHQLFRYFADYVVFDLETTGLSTSYEEVIEISALKVLGGKVVEEYSTLVNPGKHIPSGASAVNGITDKMVKDAPTFPQALAAFDAFAGDMVLVGHNIHSYDMKFMYRDAEKYFGKTFGNDYVDTYRLARALLPGLGHYTLVSLAEELGASTAGAHRALNDCGMTQILYERLGEEMNKLGTCPKCGSALVRRNGKFGLFYGCMGYPACRYTQDSGFHGI